MHAVKGKKLTFKVSYTQSKLNCWTPHHERTKCMYYQVVWSMAKRKKEIYILYNMGAKKGTAYALIVGGTTLYQYICLYITYDSYDLFIQLFK